MLERERARLEKAIQHRRRLVGVTNGTGPVRAGLDVDRLVDEVGDATFVELFEVDGRLRSVVVTGGRVRAYDVGSAADATAAVDAARFVLRQAARGRPVRLADIRARLQTALLGPSVAAFGTGPVVVSPTASLHATPWGLLPALAGVPVTVVPTASAWLRARGSRARRHGRVLVAGPGLASGGAEVPLVAAQHPEAVVLSDGSATVEGCLRAMDGAELVHVAAHGRFRADNPMFSALELDDGPLTVHDFERLRRAPHRFVLSACDSGVLVPVGAERAPRAGHGSDVDGYGGDPLQRRSGERRGDGRADGGRAPRAGRVRRPRRRDAAGAGAGRGRRRPRGDGRGFRGTGGLTSAARLG